MKTLYILLITILIKQFTFGQTITISPLESAEYCPDVETTFTVTIPGPFVSISPASGSSIINLRSFKNFVSFKGF